MTALQSVRCAGDQVFGVELSEDGSLAFGCQIFDKVAPDPELSGVPGANDTVRFFDVLYPIDAVKSAQHHPEGVLWIRGPEHRVHQEPVSILDIAPTICDLVGVRANLAWPGDSLVPRFQAGPPAGAPAAAPSLELAR